MQQYMTVKGFFNTAAVAIVTALAVPAPAHGASTCPPGATDAAYCESSAPRAHAAAAPARPARRVARPVR